MKTEKFEKFVQQYERLVFTICYQMVRDYQEAQNLTQDTFLSAYTHWEQCISGNYKAWLARIATNKAKDYLKSAYMRKVSLTDNPDDYGMTTGPPDREIISGESAGEIKQLILSLKEPYKKAAEMYFIEEKSINEISEALDRPAKTVQTQLYRAKIILRKQISDLEGKEKVRDGLVL